MNIKTNSVVNYDGTGATVLTNGYSVGILSSYGDQSFTGITTLQTISGTQISSSTISVTDGLNGNGSGLTNIPSVQSSRVIALKYIFADPPLRS